MVNVRLGCVAVDIARKGETYERNIQTRVPHRTGCWIDRNIGNASLQDSV